jgi:GTPase SAR1 family protein
VWDTAGQERHRSLSRSFYRGADVALLVYDVRNPESLKHLKQWRDEFVEAANDGSGNQPLLIVLGNKAEEPPICQYSGDMEHFLVSAKSGKNVEQAFDAIAAFALTKDQIDDQIDTKIVIPVHPTKQTEKPTCC